MKMSRLAIALALAACAKGNPVARIVVSSSGTAGVPLAFDASSSTDPNKLPLTFAWSFGDASRGGTAQLAHVYATAGSYVASVVVTNSKGVQSTAQATISVAAGAEPAANLPVRGVIRDDHGALLSGVKVDATGGATATTDSTGVVTLTAAPANAVLTLTKTGFADRIVVLDVAPTMVEAYFEAAMLTLAPPVTVNIDEGGVANGAQGATLKLPAKSVVTAGGTLATGSISVSVTPIDIATAATRKTFPGKFVGYKADASSTDIVSYGVSEVVLTQGTERLDLAPGQQADIDIPMYADSLDGVAVKVGDKVPMWSLDKKTGAWIQEGEGVVVAGASPTGFVLRGKVAHFSSWNCDKGIAPVMLETRCVTNQPGEFDDMTTHAAYCYTTGTTAGPQTNAINVANLRQTPLQQPTLNWEYQLPFVATQRNYPQPYSFAVEAFAGNGIWHGTATHPGNDNSPVLITMSKLDQGGTTGGTNGGTNGGTTGATPITFPSTGDYAIDPAGQVDTYSFPATAGDVVRVTVQDQVTSHLLGRVRLLGTTGTELSAQHFGWTDAVLAFNAPTTGTYGLEVDGTGEEPGGYKIIGERDPTLFAVVGVDPKQDASDAANAGTVVITVTFSQPVDMVTNTPSLSVAGPIVGGAYDLSVVDTQSPSANVVQFTLNQAFLPGSPYELQATAWTLDAAPTSTAYTWRVTSQPAPATAMIADRANVAVSLAGADSGRLFANYRILSNGLGFRSFHPTSGWTSDTPPGTNGAQFVMASSPSGRVLQAMRALGSNNLNLRRGFPEGGFSAVQSNLTGTTVVFDPAPAVNDADDELVIWGESGGSPHALKWSLRLPGSDGWSAKADVVQVQLGVYGLDLGADGKALAVWNDASNDSNHYATFDPAANAGAGGWSATAQVGTGSGALFVGGDGSGKALVAQWSGTALTGWYYTPAGGFGDSLAVSADAGCTPTSLLAANGHGLVVSCSTTTVFAASFDVTAIPNKFASSVTVETISSVSRVRAAMNHSGNAIAAWTTGTNLHYARYHDGTATWDTAVPVASGIVTATAFDVAIVGDDTAYIAYTVQNGSTSQEELQILKIAP